MNSAIIGRRGHQRVELCPTGKKSQGKQDVTDDASDVSEPWPEMENKGLEEMIKQNPRSWTDEEINELANENRWRTKKNNKSADIRQK